MRFVALLVVLGATPLGALSPWVLATGPTPVEVVPLEPFELVSAWRALYQADEEVWVYLTRSPNFLAPDGPQVARVNGTPWSLVVLVPQTWGRSETVTWRDRWVKAFIALASLSESPGTDPVFPAVLRTD